jgi:hypothetical protein
MLKFLKTQLVKNILFIHFSYIKILHILCVAYHKLNEMHHYIIMKIKEVLNRFFHVYAINVTMVTLCDYFFDIFYHVFTPSNFVFIIVL